VVAIILCILAFGTCYWAGKRSLGRGLVALLVFGYFYGILRANILATFSHFIFDAGLVGLYLSPTWRSKIAAEHKRSRAAKVWVAILVLWPLLLLAMPFQPLLVSLVGLRGNVFFIPLLLLGSRLRQKDLLELSAGVAILDLIAVGFAAAEYVLGVPRFYPQNVVTLIIYASIDAGPGFFRIPAIFTSAHAFGATMVATIPYLMGLWTSGEKPWHRVVALASMGAAMVGVLMSATRVNFVFGCVMVTIFVFTAKVQRKHRILFLFIIGIMAATALTNVRFQRFKSLGDTESVSERLAGSVNRNFWEILEDYPMGNGLGGGGTSIPYFLQGEVRNPIGMENEYARILSEQGVIGLLIWLAFVGWLVGRFPIAFARGPDATCRRIVWCLCLFSFGTAWIGTGLLTSIPATLFLMLGSGWTTVPPASPAATPRKRRPGLREQTPAYASAIR